jgi:hypothetical protein
MNLKRNLINTLNNNLINIITFYLGISKTEVIRNKTLVLFQLKYYKDIIKRNFYYCIICDQPTSHHYFLFKDNWYGLQELYGNKYKYIFGNTLPCHWCHKYIKIKLNVMNTIKENCF